MVWWIIPHTFTYWWLIMLTVLVLLRYLFTTIWRLIFWIFFCLVDWFGFEFLDRFFFSFGSRSDVSAQTEKVLVFIHLFLQLHCPPEWQQWTIQILGILWFKKGARKPQHVLFSRLFCSLTPHWSTQWSYLYLEICMQRPCRAGVCCALWQKNDLNLFCLMFQAFLAL